MADIYVFESNEAGKHIMGTAKKAYENYGAKNGYAYGLLDRSFAIPTKNKQYEDLPMTKMVMYIKRFIDHAVRNPNDTFHVDNVGMDNSKYPIEYMAKLFSTAPSNVVFLNNDIEQYIPKLNKKHRILITSNVNEFTDIKAYWLILDQLTASYDVEDMEFIPFKETLAGRLALGYAKKKQILLRDEKVEWNNLEVPNAVIKLNKEGLEYNASAIFNKQALLIGYATEVLFIHSDFAKTGMDILYSYVKIPFDRITIHNLY